MKLPLLVILASHIAEVSGHAYVYWPHSRHYVKDKATMHSQNVERSGIKGMTSKWGGGPPGRGGPRSSERMFWDICGNPAYSAIQGTTDSMDGFGGPPVATYEQGGLLIGQLFMVLYIVIKDLRSGFPMSEKDVDALSGSVGHSTIPALILNL